MGREGLVHAVPGLRNERNYTVLIPVTRWPK
ncbi:hypothetical protein SAMN05421869_1544 [Nonomuraea jiangxiensis]|uniref:Uncharacterized protein n=1 Tax=Nonomuraea jiangxiensis TaxID=633440 RepID=A0A1G9VP68_9ACTN|nr:hypothetical protein SAMN05421869_1544 [Nonomuraea jiangxiensis]